jgi:hypothetical protein
MLAMALAAALTAGCSEAALTTPTAMETAGRSAGAPEVLNVPSEDPGPPFYTPVFTGGTSAPAGFVPSDGVWAGIHWYRDPSCIPPGFNLLNVFNPPAAFGCALTITGQVWRHEPTDLVPYQEHYAGAGGVPIYFVRAGELAAATADGTLTIGELENLSSLLAGEARLYRGVIHNSNQAASHGHETLTATGLLADGRTFEFHFDEKFVDGQHVFQTVRIEFR